MTPIAFTLIIVFFLFWLYTFVSILQKEFKKKEGKIFWIIAVLLVPPMAVFYYFFKKKL